VITFSCGASVCYVWRLPAKPEVDRSSGFFDDDREPLADADAEADGGVAGLPALQLARRGKCEPRAGGTERMTDGDRAAVRIDARIVEVNPPELLAIEHLAR